MLSEKPYLLKTAKYLLLRFKADINKKNSIGDSPLEIAKRNQNHDLVMLFNSICE